MATILIIKLNWSKKEIGIWVTLTEGSGENQYSIVWKYGHVLIWVLQEWSRICWIYIKRTIFYVLIFLCSDLIFFSIFLIWMCSFLQILQLGLNLLRLSSENLPLLSKLPENCLCGRFFNAKLSAAFGNFLFLLKNRIDQFRSHLNLKGSYFVCNMSIALRNFATWIGFLLHQYSIIIINFKQA
jgi:hypothetical protein